MEAEVRGVRRTTTRLLRAMHAAGYGVATWAHDVVTRLAHLDCITARYLIDPAASDPEEVEYGCSELLELGGLLRDSLGPGQRAEVRRCKLQVRVIESELQLPFLCPNAVTDDDVDPDEALSTHTLTDGIISVEDAQLNRIMERLGLRVTGATSDRPAIEAHLRSLLADDQMVGVLVATLDDDALELLAALVRGDVDEQTRAELAAAKPQAAAVGDDTTQALYQAAVRLRDCGLAFAHCPSQGQRLWVPRDLKSRLDGVLRVFGL